MKCPECGGEKIIIKGNFIYAPPKKVKPKKPCPKCGRGRIRIAMFGRNRWYCYVCDNPGHSGHEEKVK